MKNSLFTRILASGTVATLVLSLLLVVLPLPRAHARLLELKDGQARFSNISFVEIKNLDEKKSEISFGDPTIAYIYDEEGDKLTVGPTVAPTVTNQIAQNITDTSAMLQATVNGGGLSTDIIVQLQDTVTNQTVTAPQFNIGAGNNQQLVSLPVNGLAPARRYNFVFNARNADGVTSPPPASFTTTGNGGGQQGVPIAQTYAATNVRIDAQTGKAAATLNGAIDPQGANTFGGFRSRTAGATWSLSPTVPLSPTAGQLLRGNVELWNLEFSTTYEFQCVALRNNAVVAEGQSMFFTTPPAPGPTVQAPGVVTLPGRLLTQGLGSFNGTVNPNGATTTWWFEYGMGSNLNLATPAGPLAGNTGTFDVGATVALQPGTWNFRLAAQNQAGTTRGTVLSITVPETGGGGGQTTITLIKAFWWSDTGMLKVEALAPQDSQLRIVELGDFGYMQFKSGRFIKKTSMAEKPDSVTIRAKDGSQITVHVAAK